jgi:hypothetical protein
VILRVDGDFATVFVASIFRGKFSLTFLFGIYITLTMVLAIVQIVIFTD